MNFYFQRVSLARFFIGVVLVAVGIVLLLTSFDVLQGDLWGNLIPLWPVLIIGLGAALLLRRYNRALSAAVLGALVAGSIVAAAVTSAVGIDLSGPGHGFNFDFGRGIKGSGHSITVDRDVGHFSRVNLLGSTDVEVTIGSDRPVRVTSDDNLVDLIRTDVRGGELRIEPDGNLRTRVDTRVSIVVPTLKGFHLTGSGNASIHGLDEDAFEIVDVGSGSVTVDGRTESLSIRISGSGDVNAADLRSNDVAIRLFGSGDAAVFASDSLDVSIDGSGDPADVSQNVDGSGRITRSR